MHPLWFKKVTSIYFTVLFFKINFALDGLFSFLLADFKQSHNFQLDDSSSDFENVCGCGRRRFYFVFFMIPLCEATVFQGLLKIMPINVTALFLSGLKHNLNHSYNFDFCFIPHIHTKISWFLFTRFSMKMHFHIESSHSYFRFHLKLAD